VSVWNNIKDIEPTMFSQKNSVLIA